MSELGINLYGLVAQLVNFGILLALLTLVLYKPVLKMLDSRAAKIKEGLEKAEEMQTAAQRAQAESAAIIEQSRKEGQVILARAEQMGSRMKEEAQMAAKGEAEHFLARARADIEREKLRAMAEIRAEVANLALMAAGRVIGQSLDSTTHYRIVEEALDQAKLNG